MKLLYLVESGESKFLVFDEMPDKISTKYGELRFRGDAGCITWRKVTVDEIIEHFKRR